MRALLLVPLLAPLLAGCPGSPSSDASTDADASVDALDAHIDIDARDATPETSPDAGPPDSNPSKGPWVLRTDTTRATIRWESRIEPPTVAVGYGLESGGAMSTAMGASRSVVVTASYGTDSSLVRYPDFAGTFYMNEVSLDGLAPGTCYHYVVAGAPASSGRFCTMHDASDHTTPIRFLVIGDTNPALGYTVPILQQVLPHQPEFCVHLGDLQYYSSIIESWQYWFHLMTPLMSAGAFYPSIGNHENELMGTEFADYYARFWDSPQFDGDTYRYHFQTGGIHFFALDTEEDLSMGSPQWTWLSQELDAAETSAGFRFSVLYFHRPPYTLGDVDPDLTVRTALAPLVASHHVPLVMSGHMHGYERFLVNGVTFLVSGGGGGVIGNVNAGVPAHPDDVPLRVASGPYYHAVVMTVTPGNLHADVIDAMGVERDTFDITVP